MRDAVYSMTTTTYALMLFSGKGLRECSCAYLSFIKHHFTVIRSLFQSFRARQHFASVGWARSTSFIHTTLDHQRLPVTHGGTLTQNKKDNLDAVYFFCDGLLDPWVSRYVRSASYASRRRCYMPSSHPQLSWPDCQQDLLSYVLYVFAAYSRRVESYCLHWSHYRSFMQTGFNTQSTKTSQYQ